jgi:hypothetical protein
MLIDREKRAGKYETRKKQRILMGFVMSVNFVFWIIRIFRLISNQGIMMKI